MAIWSMPIEPNLWRRVVRTHFRVLVVLDKTEYAQTNDQLNEWLKPVMAPYSERLSVPEYEVACDCLDIAGIWGRTANGEYGITGPKEVGIPDPDCDECSGTGKHMTTWNPRALWDYWTTYVEYAKDGYPTLNVSRGIKTKDLPEYFSCMFALLPGGMQVGDKFGPSVTLDGYIPLLLLPYAENICTILDIHS